MYNIIVSPRALKEIDESINYYAVFSNKIPLLFVQAIETAFYTLNKNPYYAIRYKNVRGYKLKKFPYNLYYSINEAKQSVRILACYHNKRNPQQKPKL